MSGRNTSPSVPAEGTAYVQVSYSESSSKIIIVNNVGMNYFVNMPPSLEKKRSGKDHHGDAPIIVHHVGDGGTSNERKLATLSNYFQNNIIIISQQEQHSLEVIAMAAAADAEPVDHYCRPNTEIGISGSNTSATVEGMVSVPTITNDN